MKSKILKTQDIAVQRWFAGIIKAGVLARLHGKLERGEAGEPRLLPFRERGAVAPVTTAMNSRKHMYRRVKMLTPTAHINLAITLLFYLGPWCISVVGCRLQPNLVHLKVPQQTHPNQGRQRFDTC
jgi:hypothetical protein